MRAVNILGLFGRKASGRRISIFDYASDTKNRGKDAFIPQVMLMFIVADNKQRCNLYLVVHCAA
jgi:hypothetical protein